MLDNSNRLLNCTMTYRNWTSWRLYLRGVSINLTNWKEDLLHTKSSWQTISKVRVMPKFYQMHFVAGIGITIKPREHRARNDRKPANANHWRNPFLTPQHPSQWQWMPTSYALRIFEEWGYQVADWLQGSMMSGWGKKSGSLTGVYMEWRRWR